MDQNSTQDGFQYRGQNDSSTDVDSMEAAPQPIQEEPLLQWKASEFIHHQKGMAWILPLVAIALALAVLTYILTRDILSTVVVVMGAAAFGILAFQRPRTLTYVLFPHSIKIGPKTYTYDSFKSFSIVQNGALNSIFLEPLQRFMPPLTVYFPPEEAEAIFTFLADRLPHIERSLDPVERLMQKIRF